MKSGPRVAENIHPFDSAHIVRCVNAHDSLVAERDTLKAQCAAQAALLSAFQDGGAEANEAAREDLIDQLEAERDALKAEKAAGFHALSNHTKPTP